MGEFKQRLVLGTATLARPAPVRSPAWHAVVGYGLSGGLVGERDLIVTSTRLRGPHSERRWLLWRLVGHRRVSLRTSKQEMLPLAVDAGRIAVRWGDRIAVLRADGSLVRRLAAHAAGLSVAFAGRRLVTAKGGTLSVFDPRTGTRVRHWRLPPSQGATAQLVDGHGGLAVYLAGRAIHVVRIRDGRELVLRPPGEGDVFAQFGATGLFYAYSTQERPRGRVVIFTTAQITSRLAK